MGRRKRAISDEDSYQNKIEELRQRAAKDALSGLLNRAAAEPADPHHDACRTGI